MPSLAMPLEEGRVVLPGSFPLIMAMHLAPWRNYRIQMVTAKSNPLCGGRFVAAAALGAEMGFGRLGGVSPAPPIPKPLSGLAGVCGGIAHLGPRHPLGVGRGVQPADSTFAGISRVRVYADLC